jgi:HEPN domain-containing protein
MPPERAGRGDPHRWLRRASGDLAIASQGRTLPGAFLEDLCFHAQQAAEKAIKAVLLHKRIRFRKTHSIRELLSVCQSNAINVPEEILVSAVLTQYAIEVRYPEDFEPVTSEEYTRAVELAQRVYLWAELILGRPPA